MNDKRNSQGIDEENLKWCKELIDNPLAFLTLLVLSQGQTKNKSATKGENNHEH